MKLFLKNIGKIGTATIDLNGITVIAGENNTGKSTIGKALFAVFNGFYNIETKIKMERDRYIERLINSIFYSGSLNGLDDNFIESVVEELDSYSNSNVSENTIKDTINKYIPENLYYELKDITDKTSRKIFDLFKMEQFEFILEILENSLLTEFSYQMSNIFSEEESIITLTIKEKDIDLKIKENKLVSVDNKIQLGTEVIYIDNPFLIDDIKRISLYRLNRNIYLRHDNLLIEKLQNEYSENTIVDRINVKKSFEYIFNKINLGELVKSGRRISYRNKNSDKTLRIENLSTGIKSFMIMKTLLLNGHLSENGTIVLDEPEVHLHPEWQLIFAELIVLLQKEFNMHILLTTHSPYFINAIEVYSAKHKVNEKCKFYLAENDGNISKFNDVTNDLSPIYRKLSRPLQELEDEDFLYE